MAEVNKTIIFDSLIISGCTSGSTSGVTFGTETFDVDTPLDNVSYVGYGEVSACKIKQITTVSGATYTTLWSNGEEDLDKIWANRLSYSYF
tara:strand:+ start:15003 stop:15275 length:273 start_codon:yes stop_codon:yes gene_type:complete